MRPLVAVAALLGLAVACSSPTGPTPGTPESVTAGGFTSVILTRGTMSATVDGTRWTAVTLSGSTGTFGSGVGAATISGIALGATPLSPGVFLSISAPLAPGTHTLGGPTYVSFSLTEGFNIRWSADPLRGAGAGSVTFTTATPTRLTGTFSFSAVATATGMSPESRIVTNGAFDLLP